MKDLSLSLLSRGCGRLVSSNKNNGRHNGRLDVCFTPQDYYIWKSQESLLRLSNSGRLIVEPESTLPKTYSTRRGPLLLYSQDLVTVETSYESGAGNRKKRVVQQYNKQVEQQLSRLKELTAAILSYSNIQFTSSRPAPPLFPPRYFPPVPDLCCPSPLPIGPTRAQPNPDLHVQTNPQWLPAEENTEQLENLPEGNKNGETDRTYKEEEPCSRTRVRLDLFLQIPYASKAPTPQTEPQPWVHYVAISPEEPVEPQAYLEMSLQHSESSQRTETNHHSTSGELHHPNMDCVHDVAVDQDCSIRTNSGTTSDKVNYERSSSGNRHGRIVRLCGAEQQSNTEPETITTSGLFLPPLKVGHGPCWEKTDGLREESLDSDKHSAQHLPPIAQCSTVDPAQVIQYQTQQHAQPWAERDGFQPKENVNRPHQHPVFLPLLFPEKAEEISGKQRGGREKTERQYLKKQAAGQGGAGGGSGRLPSEKGSMILLEPGKEPAPPVGVLGCVAGRKGPGKQSSFAFLQSRLLDSQDPCETSNANRGVVRGVLPLELRDLQNGESVGSLILGPDGEIIQLSLYNNSQDPSQGDDGTQQQALQVLSTEGEKLPWVILLQPEHTHTEAGVELNTDVLVGNIEHHQFMHKKTGSHMSFGQFGTGEHSLSTEQLSDLHSLTETNACLPISHTNTAAVAQKKTKSTEAVTDTWKKQKKDAKNNVRMPPLREWAGREEPRGGDPEEEEEEELAKTGQTSHLSRSHQSGQQNISPAEATTEEAVDRRRRNIKRRDTEEAVVTTGKRDMKTVKNADSDGQRTSRMSKEGRRQRQKAEGDSQPIGSQKQEERTNREAAETQDHSALPSVKKKMRHREGERGEVKTNEKGEERGGEVAGQREESAGRRRRKGRLKHKELVVGNHEDSLEKEEVEINQEMEEDSYLKSTKRSSATRRHKSKTRRNSEEDVETDVSTSDKQSSIRSVNSFRSSQFNQRSSRRSAASSCEGAVPASSMGLASACGRLSSCSTVMVTDEQLMLNPVKPESSMARKSQEEEEEAAALRLAQRAERRRQEVERRRREREEEEERKQQEKEQTEERMKTELEGERRKRAEELRLKKLAEEEERRRREEEEQERVRREQAQRERERRRQEEKRRQMERLQRMREEEELRKKAELERLQLEEQRRQEEESKKLQEMDEDERIEYLRRKEQEEEDRRRKEEERKRREEEAAQWAAEEARLQAELLTREMALLQQQLAFKRGLVLEAGGLEKTQGISRPWIYSYFTLLQLLGLNPSKAET